MGSKRTKEDDVLKISTFVFVTNFPEQASVKDLWNACKQYGHVVGAFIPNKRSKAGKRFGFDYIWTKGYTSSSSCTAMKGKIRRTHSIGNIYEHMGIGDDVSSYAQWSLFVVLQLIVRYSEFILMKKLLLVENEDEDCEEVFKKDFGESDEEVQGENDVSRVSDTEVEEENPKSKDGVVSSEQNGGGTKESLEYPPVYSKERMMLKMLSMDKSEG
ncbi:nucleotide-binding alpha-beta plait domain-containing protein [Tanacetum coccineum]